MINMIEDECTIASLPTDLDQHAALIAVGQFMVGPELDMPPFPEEVQHGCAVTYEQAQAAVGCIYRKMMKLCTKQVVETPVEIS